MAWSELLLIAGCALAAVAALMVATTLWARAVDRVSVVDVSWGLGFVLVALVGFAVGSTTGADRTRCWVLVVIVFLWGERLARHIIKRSRGHGEDPRYAEMLGGTPSQVGIGAAVRRVFVVQGVAIWVVSLPIQVGMVSDVEWWPVVWVGVAVWAVGILFEAVGDAQLATYRSLPKDQKPPVMETGLWRYTRHPNYFGDACVAWGFWLVGGLASGWLPALLTVLAPVAMTYFLVFATGARLLERTMMQRPGYPEYAARTSMFFPLPPKRG